MVQIIETIDVDVPVGTAYNQWTQFESFPKFLDEVESITQLDATHTHWKVKVAGIEREFDAEITEQHPDERVAWNSTGGETNHAGVVTFHKLTDSSSRVTVQLDWEPEGLLEKVGALVGAGSHAVKKDLKNFKGFIESQGAESAARRGLRLPASTGLPPAGPLAAHAHRRCRPLPATSTLSWSNEADSSAALRATATDGDRSWARRSISSITV